MTTQIEKVSDRKGLPHRREPYWTRLRQGVYLGYRTAADGAGTWIARRREDDGKQKYQALGHFDRYDDARRAAEQWASQSEQGVDNFEATVGDACRQYVAHLRLHKSATSAKDAEGRFARLVYGKPLERVRLSKLTTKDTREWLNDQIDEDEDDDELLRRAKASANRSLDSLKAALNMALRDRLVAMDAGWKTVLRFKDVSRRRERFLTLQQRTDLMKACPPDLAALCKGLLLTAARPGELSGASVCDFDQQQGTLTLDGKTGRRTVTLSSAAVAFFSEQSRGRIGKAPLLCRESGERWAKDGWKKVFKKAVSAAHLPDDVVLYSLRHAAISEFVAGGMDAFIVAKLAGTSTEMIDKHYGHLRHDRTRHMMDAVQVV